MPEETEWTGTVEITREQIQTILHRQHIREGIADNRIEIIVEEIIKDQFPDDISNEDRYGYIGSISCVIWTQYRYEQPRLLKVYQKPGGSFVTKSE